MNNNRGNNRRRGRGNNRQQGGQPLNRIDSRARGNAPQLLEKYRKMAHDAHLNGDRVQEEYYLQFADHYFRVMADQRQRQEDMRQPRRDDRFGDQDEPGDGEDNVGSVFEVRPSGQERDRNEGALEPDAGAIADSDEADEVRQDNPFLRETRGFRSNRSQRRPRERDTRVDDANDDSGQVASGLDPATLPPPISSTGEAGDETGAAEKPKPRRRTRRTAPPADESGESLEAVN